MQQRLRHVALLLAVAGLAAGCGAGTGAIALSSTAGGVIRG